MEKLKYLNVIILLFCVLPRIQTTEVAENADVPLMRLEHLEQKFQELEHLVKSLEETLHGAQKTTTMQRSDIPNNSYNNAKRFLLSYHKRSNMPNPNVPAEEDDPDLQTFEHQLTSEQQQLIKKMKSKLKYLQAVLHEPQQEPNSDEVSPVQMQSEKKSVIPLGVARQYATNNHKRSDLPDPKVPDENSDAELQSFEQNLTPEQQELVKKMKNKLKYLQAVLHEPQQEPNPEEVSPVQTQSEKKSVIPLGAARQYSANNHKRSDLPDPKVPDEDSDAELQSFEQKLTPEQQELVKKMKNKIKYLQAVLHEPVSEHTPDGEPSAEVQVMARTPGGTDEVKPSAEDDKTLSDFMVKLTPEQQALLKKNENKLQFLKAALSELQQSPNSQEDPEEVTETKKEFTDEEEEEAEGEVSFTAADRKLLQEVNQKLNELQKSLESFRRIYLEKEKHPSTENEETDERQDHKMERNGEFGEFVEVRRKRERDSEWHDSSVSENNLGLVKKRCKNCDCGDKNCDCDACDLSVTDKISKRLVTGVRNDATKAINLKQLLHVLSQVRENAHK